MPAVVVTCGRAVVRPRLFFSVSVVVLSFIHSLARSLAVGNSGQGTLPGGGTEEAIYIRGTLNSIIRSTDREGRGKDILYMWRARGT